MKIDKNALKVIHNKEGQRFEIHIEKHKPVLDYRLSDETITFTHTGVPRELEGNGIGSLIVRAGLDYARSQDYRVIPLCPFVATYIQRHDEYTDLLATKA